MLVIVLFSKRQKHLPAFLTNKSIANSDIKRPFKTIPLKKATELSTSKPPERSWYKFHSYKQVQHIFFPWNLGILDFRFLNLLMLSEYA